MTDARLADEILRWNGGRKIACVDIETDFRWTEEELRSVVDVHVQEDLRFRPSDAEVEQLLAKADGSVGTLLELKDKWLSSKRR